MTHASSDPFSSAREALSYDVKPTRANSRSSSKLLRTANRPSAQLPRRAQALFDDAADDESISRARFLEHRQTEPVDKANTPAPANASAAVVRPPTPRDGRAKVQ